MKKRIGAVLAAAAVTASCCGAAAMLSASGADSGTVKIMCIGDSITDGYGIDGSYRKFLYHELTLAGCSVNMLGDYSNSDYMATYNASDGTSFTYDSDHAGHSGYSILSYSGRTGIYEPLHDTGCLAAQVPDIVILQIGTNDVLDNHELSSAGERLTTLVEYILGEIPASAALFVTTIPDLEPNRSDVYSWFSSYRYDENWNQRSDAETEIAVQAAVDGYNATVKSTVTSLQSKHSNLYFGDVHSAITDTVSQLNDGVHPNNVGYERMGKYWANVLLNYLGGSISQPTATETTTTTTETTTTTTETTTTTTTTTTETTTTTTTTTTTETTTTTTTTTADTTTTETTTTTEQPVVPVTGDVDGDGALTLTDAVLLQRHLLTVQALDDASLIRADLNGDRQVNAVDLSRLKQYLLA